MAVFADSAKVRFYFQTSAFIEKSLTFELMKPSSSSALRRVIIIGASSGIGREIALLYIRRGWYVGVAARRQEELNQLKALAPERVQTAYVDITQHGCENNIAQLFHALGDTIDVYWHVAGVGRKNYDLSEGIEIQTVHTNAAGFVRSIGMAYRHMAQQGYGHIAIVSSIAGTKGLGPAPAYSATKALQNTYLQALEQLAHRNGLPLHFTDIRPGFVNTALLAPTQSESPQRYPMLLNPEKVARKAVAATDKQRHIVVIDSRWRCLTVLWRRVPRWLWRRLKL